MLTRGILRGATAFICVVGWAVQAFSQDAEVLYYGWKGEKVPLTAS